MTTVFHTWPYGRFIEIQNNLRRKKLHRTNPGSNFLGGSFSNREMQEPQSNLQEKVNPCFLRDYFSSTTAQSIFTSTAPVLLDQSNETSWVFPALKSTSLFMPWSTMSRRSDSSSEANSSCWKVLALKPIFLNLSGVGIFQFIKFRSENKTCGIRCFILNLCDFCIQSSFGSQITNNINC